MSPNGNVESLRVPEVDEVHVWTARLSHISHQIAAFAGLLAVDEKQRAARFFRDEDRIRFIAARGILRRMLGRYLSEEPAALTFITNDFGKPFLARRADQLQLSFNIAHSGDVVLYAVAADRRVGIDVEAIRTDLDILGLAQGQFSTMEIETLRTTIPAEQVGAFFRCWTRKEAYVKARGEGLGFSLKQFAVSFANNEPPVVQWAADDPLATERWSLFDLQPAPGYAAAVIVDARPTRLLSRRWGWKA